jgi:hypothetical protein
MGARVVVCSIKRHPQLTLKPQLEDEGFSSVFMENSVGFFKLRFARNA